MITIGYVALLAAASITRSPLVQAATTVIPSNSLSSYTTLEQFWAYLYPWGSDHNGSARMVGNSSYHENIAIASSTLSLIATPTSGAVPPTSTANPNPAIHYASGTIHALEQITVTSENSYTISGDFSAPTTFGKTWPAFGKPIPAAVVGWPPEADLGEWKGTTNTWFNTFNTSTVVVSDLVPWPSDLSFHTLMAVLTAESNNKDVRIDFYMDGELKTTQFGSGFVGAALWLIIDLQMEGSSGSPGPTGTTTYKIRNVEVTRSGD
ncbi:glycoside hydrolase family 16 protein [Rhodocollybia butyracea]|uniref:Glycoside hydrolase family 16 protein n=1 Tax=Rhodocollybia butyracea TaxID=206335 RepID=A0A9P5PVT9_9AGAR|nr:glycoside hydrolase family 16 protein [Rhodocollybia butyracea]